MFYMFIHVEGAQKLSWQKLEDKHVHFSSTIDLVHLIFLMRLFLYVVCSATFDAEG
jgi:hypothetical protein